MTRSNARLIAPFALFLMLAPPSSRATDVYPESPISPLEDRALVEILEFGDLMCPLTRISHETIHTLLSEYGDLLIFEFRHAPFSRGSIDAARLAEVARREGRLGPFLDAVSLAPLEADLRAIAEAVLAPRRLAPDSKDESITVELGRALSLAKALELRGTPTFFVNGVPIEGAEPASTFRPLVDALIATARQRHRAGPEWLEEQRRVHNRRLYDLLREPPVALPAQEVGALGPQVSTRYIFSAPAPVLRDSQVSPARTLTLFGDPTSPGTLELIALVFDNLPMDTNIELRFALRADDATAPAYAALSICADAQGRFIAFLDALRLAPPETRSPTRLIAEARLDPQRLLECLRSPLPNLLLERHRSEADLAGLTSFPALFIDGERLELPAQADPDEVLAQLLAAQKAAPLARHPERRPDR